MILTLKMTEKKSEFLEESFIQLYFGSAESGLASTETEMNFSFGF
jgi:hypothetical protein